MAVEGHVRLLKGIMSLISELCKNFFTFSLTVKLTLAHAHPFTILDHFHNLFQLFHF